MELGQLRTLVYVAELGSISKAADRLCTAQPALSRQVRLLEQELGEQLFDRHGRGMTLTEKGKVVFQHAKRVLHEVDDIRESMVDRLSALDGTVSIGLTPTVAEMIATPLLESLRRSYPEATFQIVSAYSLYLLEWIYAGSIDVAILYDPKALRSLKSEPFMSEELFAVAAVEHQLDPHVPLKLSELSDKPLILPSKNHSLRDILEERAHEAGVTLHPVVEANSYSVLKRLVLNGMGWTVLPVGPVKADIDCSRLSYAPLTDPSPSRRLELSFPTDRPASLLANAARRALIEVAADLVDSGAWPGKMLVHPGRAIPARKTLVAAT